MKHDRIAEDVMVDVVGFLTERRAGWIFSATVKAVPTRDGFHIVIKGQTQAGAPRKTAVEQKKDIEDWEGRIKVLAKKATQKMIPVDAAVVQAPAPIKKPRSRKTPSEDTTAPVKRLSGWRDVSNTKKMSFGKGVAEKPPAKLGQMCGTPEAAPKSEPIVPTKPTIHTACANTGVKVEQERLWRCTCGRPATIEYKPGDYATTAQIRERGGHAL